MDFSLRENSAYYGRLREVLDVSGRALIALFAAIVLAGVGAVWNTLVFIPAALSAVVAVVEAFLVVQRARADAAGDWKALLASAPCRAGAAKPRAYRVDTEVLPEGQAWLYIERDFDGRLRDAIRDALASSGPRLVMLCGESKAGKTRAAFQALSSPELRDAWLLVPRDGASVEALLRAGMLPKRWRPLVIWLDDVERFASVDATGFHAGVLSNLPGDRPVVLLATEGGRGRQRYASDSQLVDPVEQLRDLAAQIPVPLDSTTAELARTQGAYGKDFAAETERLGLGRRMVAVGKLREKLASGRHDPADDPCREGLAVLRAAIDWRRAGAQSSLTVEYLDLLYRHYLPNDLDPSEELLARGLRWARAPLPGTEISLLRKNSEDPLRFEAYDLAVAEAAKAWPDISIQAAEEMVRIATPLDAFQMAGPAHKAENDRLAAQLLRRAEESSDPGLTGVSAFNLGVVLESSGDVEGTIAAYRRANERGNVRSAHNLGFLLHQQGDTEGAIAAYRHADERGDVRSAHNLGLMLYRQGDTEGAIAAFRRADERGDGSSAHNLGFLLHQQGDTEGAIAAFRRADERGNAESAHNLGVLLHEQGNTDEGAAAFRRAEERGLKLE